MRRIPIRLVSLLLLLPPVAARAQVALLIPSQDNTLYEDPAGALSNGAGEYLFTGATAGIEPRRALLAFDVAGGVPPGATIDSAALILNVSNVPPGSPPTTVSLHRVLAPWGEGASDASGPEGMGAPSAPGDATWLHTFFSSGFWTLAGGDFEAAASAVRTVSGLGPATWGSTPEMVADVQDWLDSPAGNFGWLLLGDESLPRTARRYDSRASVGPGARPRLAVEYSGVPQRMSEIPTLSQWGLVAMAALLFAVAVRRL